MQDRNSDFIIADLIESGRMQEFADYFENNLQETFYPHNRYDAIIMKMEDNEDYYFGTLAAHGFDALKSGGIFVLDINNCAIDEDKTLTVMQLFFTYNSEMSRSGYYVFQKTQ